MSPFTIDIYVILAMLGVAVLLAVSLALGFQSAFVVYFLKLTGSRRNLSSVLAEELAACPYHHPI